MDCGILQFEMPSKTTVIQWSYETCHLPPRWRKPFFQVKLYMFLHADLELIFNLLWPMTGHKHQYLSVCFSCLLFLSYKNSWNTQIKCCITLQLLPWHSASVEGWVVSMCMCIYFCSERQWQIEGENGF